LRCPALSFQLALKIAQSEGNLLDLTPAQLELLELVQCGFHLLLMSAGRASADPVPSLHQKFSP
jgi:hypothetical protein